MSTDFYNFWRTDALINFLQYEVLLTAPNVPYTIVAKMNCQISTCSTAVTRFIFTKPVFVLKPNFDIFAEIRQKKMLKNACCSLA